MEINLSNLILKYQMENDKEAIEELISYFNDITTNISKKLNYEEAQTDILICLIELLKRINLKSYNNNNSIRAMVIRSLVNKRTDLFRKNILKKQEEYELNLDIVSTYFDNDKSLLIIEDLIKPLSSKQREVIKLSFVDQYSDIEISKIMNVSRQAVGQMKKRSLNLLKEFIVI